MSYSGRKGSGSQPPRNRLPELDRLKGILIALIVAGHNNLISGEFPGFFNVIYNFHVACFLLLPFVLGSGAMDGVQFRARVARYLVPHFFFFALATSLYFLIFVAKDLDTIGVWAMSVAGAIVFSTEGFYREASGFGLFWFLPALLTLLALRALHATSNRSGRLALLALTLAVHLFLGSVPEELLRYFPWSLALVGYLFPLGLATGALWKRSSHNPGFIALGGLTFAACVWASPSLGLYAALAGDPVVPSILQPLRLVFHDVFLVSAFIAMFGLARLLPWHGLGSLGNRSLCVFLTHSFIWQALLRSGVLDFLEGGVGFGPVTIGIASFFATILASYALCLLLERLPNVYRMIFPKNWAGWPPVQAFSASTGSRTRR